MIKNYYFKLLRVQKYYSSTAGSFYLISSNTIYPNFHSYLSTLQGILREKDSLSLYLEKILKRKLDA